MVAIRENGSLLVDGGLDLKALTELIDQDSFDVDQRLGIELTGPQSAALATLLHSRQEQRQPHRGAVAPTEIERSPPLATLKCSGPR